MDVRLYDWYKTPYGMGMLVVEEYRSDYFCLYFPNMPIGFGINTVNNPHGLSFKGHKCLWVEGLSIEKVGG